jgi:hypothetical protein
VTADRTAALAQWFTARLNGDSVSKAFGATVTADDMYPAALLVTEAEDRLEALRLASADLGARIEALCLMDPPLPLRPAGAAGLTGTADILEKIDRALAPVANGATQ